MKIHTRVLLIVLFAATFIVSCGKRNDTGVPLVAVDIYLYTSDPQFINLQVVNGWEYVTGGSKGIIVFRRGNEEFMAYDRHSPYEPENNCIVQVNDTTNITVHDPCSSSQWQLYDGQVSNGPAALPLKQYQTTFDGTVLHIFN